MTEDSAVSVINRDVKYSLFDIAFENKSSEKFFLIKRVSIKKNISEDFIFSCNDSIESFELGTNETVKSYVTFMKNFTIVKLDIFGLLMILQENDKFKKVLDYELYSNFRMSKNRITQANTCFKMAKIIIGNMLKED